ncbi:MAG TPA: hypothetical protein VHI13_00690 [Candidatus Kapabacteria bacterium]|nr:hypothetical protein [Candidatus Kapabacteria bacterium]
MKKLWIAAIMLVALIAAGSSAHAQGNIAVQKGRRIVCVVICHGVIIIRFADGTTATVTSDASGSATLESQGPTANVQQPNDFAYLDGGNLDGNGPGGIGDPPPPPTPTSTSFTPVSISVSGNDATYGDFSFTFDASRSVQNSTVTANQVGTDFPATADVYANVTGTISGIAGTFTNSTVCHMRTTNLRSFDPNINETYTFVNDVDFTNGNGDSFTIPAGATVTLN